MTSEPERLIVFEKALLKVYDCYNVITDVDRIGIWKINPYVSFEKIDKMDRILAHDIVTGEEYELNQLAYETILFMEHLRVLEAQEALLNANIFSQYAYRDFIKIVKESRFLIEC